MLFLKQRKILINSIILNFGIGKLKIGIKTIVFGCLACKKIMLRIIHKSRDDKNLNNILRFLLPRLFILSW